MADSSALVAFGRETPDAFIPYAHKPRKALPLSQEITSLIIPITVRRQDLSPTMVIWIERIVSLECDSTMTLLNFLFNCDYAFIVHCPP